MNEKNSYSKKSVKFYCIWFNNSTKTISIEELSLNVWAYEETQMLQQLEHILKFTKNFREERIA